MERIFSKYENGIMKTIKVVRNGSIFQVCPECPSLRFKGGSPSPPPPPPPTPTPIVGREEEEAKKKVRSKKGGRASTILAGGLTQAQNTNILNTKLG